MTISTEEDVIRVIRENPRLLFQALYEDRELLNEVRRLVLTEDVLEMPEQVGELVERQGRMEAQVGEVVERQGRMETQVGEVVERQGRMETQMGKMETRMGKMETQMGKMETRLDEVVEQQGRMETRLGTVETRLDEVVETQDRMNDQLGHLTGAELEREIVRILPSRLNRIYGLYRTRVIQGRGVRSEQGETFLDAVEDATLASVITEEQRQRIEETDMIVRARRQDSRETIYISVEAFATIRERDITRANDSAIALQAAFDAESTPVAAGYQVRSEDRMRAENVGVELIILDHPWQQDQEPRAHGV